MHRARSQLGRDSSRTSRWHSRTRLVRSLCANASFSALIQPPRSAAGSRFTFDGSRILRVDEVLVEMVPGDAADRQHPFARPLPDGRWFVVIPGQAEFVVPTLQPVDQFSWYQPAIARFWSPLPPM
eukprot:865141-Prymnesium_polylepis.1